MGARFPHGPGTELNPISDAYIAAIHEGNESDIERLREEVYRITGPYVGARSIKGSRKSYSHFKDTLSRCTDTGKGKGRRTWHG